MTDRVDGESGREPDEQLSWFDRWIRPYAAESTLWPVLIVVLAHIAAFLTPVVLFALRDRRIPAMAALTLVLVLCGRAIAVDLAQRRVGLITGLVTSIWLLTAVMSYCAARWHLI